MVTNEEIIALLVKAKNATENLVDYPETNDVFEDNVIITNDNVITKCSFCDIAFKLFDSDMKMEIVPEVYKFCETVFLDETNKNNGEAANYIGRAFYIGRGVDQDYKRAAEFYTIAAYYGSIVACENLGYIYYYGRCGEVDYKEAHKYFTKAALLGDPQAMYKLGDMYMNGYYVDKDERLAFQLFCQCSNQVCDDMPNEMKAGIYSRLGRCFHKGIGTEVDLNEALHCFNLAEYCFIKEIENGNNKLRKSLERLVKDEEAVRAQLLQGINIEK